MHVGDLNHATRRQRHKTFAHQIEIGDAVDLVVIGHAGIAIAEADFWPHIDLDLAAAGFCGATECAAGRPSVARKRPCDFPPAVTVRADMLIAGERRRRADRNN
jgi:hypothetical protein